MWFTRLQESPRFKDKVEMGTAFCCCCCWGHLDSMWPAQEQLFQDSGLSEESVWIYLGFISAGPCVSNRRRLKLSFWKSACLCLSLQMPFCVTLEEHCILPIEDVIMKTLIFPAHHCLVRFSEEGYKAKVASVSWLWQSPIASFIQIIALPYPLKVALIS